MTKAPKKLRVGQRVLLQGIGYEDHPPLEAKIIGFAKAGDPVHILRVTKAGRWALRGEWWPAHQVVPRPPKLKKK